MEFEGRLKGSDSGSRAPRIDTGFLVRVRCAAGAFPGRVTNLSSTGFGLRSAKALEPGLEITLEMPKRSPIKGVIRWVAGKEAGGEFLDSAIL